MVAAIGAAGAIGGALISSNAAGNAADAQQASSQQATQAQMAAAAQQRQDLAPWTSSGGAAQSRLNQYLGIGGVGTGGVTSLGLGTGLTPDQVRQQLLSRYTSTSTPASTTPYYADQRAAIDALGLQGGIAAWQAQLQGKGTTDNPLTNGLAPTSTPTSTVDEAGLNAAIQQYYAEQDAQNAKAASDPSYGSLLTPFHNGQEFSFTGDDLQNSPGYQFGLNQGTQGINNAQAARGNLLSGAAMKELDRYNQDYAGTKFNDAFNQAQSTFNTNLNAYTNNQDRVFNFLSGVSRLGQNSAANVGTGDLQVGNNIANNALASGNAQAAGAVASGNALQSGINSTVNSINTAGGWNTLLSGQSAYDFGANGQSNPANQAGLTNLMNQYVG